MRFRRIITRLFSRGAATPTPPQSAALAGLEQTLTRLRAHAQNPDGKDPELVMLARMLHATGESLNQLGLRLEQCVAAPRVDPETRAAILRSMEDLLVISRSYAEPPPLSGTNKPVIETGRSQAKSA